MSGGDGPGEPAPVVRGDGDEPSRDGSPSSPGVLVVIPARFASSRFPGKPLAPLLGRPLILHVLDRVRGARLPDDVVVATDDRRIQKVVEEAGGRACMTSADHPSGTDRVWEAARGSDCDIIVNVQGDEPLLESEVIDLTIHALQGDSSADMATAAVRLEGTRLKDPNVVKVVWDLAGHALYFSRAPIPWSRDEAEDPGPAGASGTPGGFGAYQHVGIYAYRKQALRKFVAAAPHPLERTEKLEQLRALALGMTIAVRVVESRSVGVDTPDDLERVERWLRSSSS